MTRAMSDLHLFHIPLLLAGPKALTDISTSSLLALSASSLARLRDKEVEGEATEEEWIDLAATRGGDTPRLLEAPSCVS